VVVERYGRNSNSDNSGGGSGGSDGAARRRGRPASRRWQARPYTRTFPRLSLENERRATTHCSQQFQSARGVRHDAIQFHRVKCVVPVCLSLSLEFAINN